MKYIDQNQKTQYQSYLGNTVSKVGLIYNFRHGPGHLHQLRRTSDLNFVFFRLSWMSLSQLYREQNYSWEKPWKLSQEITGEGVLQAELLGYSSVEFMGSLSATARWAAATMPTSILWPSQSHSQGCHHGGCYSAWCQEQKFPLRSRELLIVPQFECHHLRVAFYIPSVVYETAWPHTSGKVGIIKLHETLVSISQKMSLQKILTISFGIQ